MCGIVLTITQSW